MFLSTIATDTADASEMRDLMRIVLTPPNQAGASAQRPPAETKSAFVTTGGYMEAPISRNEAGDAWRGSVEKFNAKFDKLMGGSNGNG